MICRHCKNSYLIPLVDLGSSPPSNMYLTDQENFKPEVWYPLKVYLCEKCLLVQTIDFVKADELFHSNYAYFSGYSDSWISHCENFVNYVVDRFNLDSNDTVIEIASNDGSLLQFFKNRNIKCYGVEPTQIAAEVAIQKGIDTFIEFFGTSYAKKLRTQGIKPKLLIANNVLAHVPDINDFLGGIDLIMSPDSIATFEFPHFLHLIDGLQFDTIYHEHYSYLSLTAANKIFNTNGLEVFDVEEIKTHGGSLRLFVQKLNQGLYERHPNVQIMLEREKKLGLNNLDYMRGFQKDVENVKNKFLQFLLKAKEQKKMVVGYGAAAKGNTLLNFAGVRPDLVSYIVDKNPYKQNMFCPGSKIPIVSENRLMEDKPDFVIIFPWNFKNEIKKQLEYIREWDGQFVTAIPKLSVF